jgi:hypothetical protein
MYKATLTKISDNKNALRTTQMEGVFFEIPAINRSFRIIGEAISQGCSGRLIYTSKVQRIHVEDEQTANIFTLNSVYEIKLHEGKFSMESDVLKIRD